VNGRNAALRIGCVSCTREQGDFGRAEDPIRVV